MSVENVLRLKYNRFNKGEQADFARIPVDRFYKFYTFIWLWKTWLTRRSETHSNEHFWTMWWFFKRNYTEFLRCFFSVDTSIIISSLSQSNSLISGLKWVEVFRRSRKLFHQRTLYFWLLMTWLSYYICKKQSYHMRHTAYRRNWSKTLRPNVQIWQRNSFFLTTIDPITVQLFLLNSTNCFHMHHICQWLFSVP